MSEKSVYLIAHQEVEYTLYKSQTGYSRGMVRPASFYKIGIAKDPEGRCSGMNGSTPHDLELVTTIECDDAKHVESELHSMYSRNCVGGEWFKLTSNDVNSFMAIDALESDTISKLRDKWILEGRDWDKSLYIELCEVRGERHTPPVHTTH